MIVRTIQQQIEATLFKGKVMIIYGARRVGKTTMSKEILKKYEGSHYINCELLQNKMALQTTNSEILKRFLGDYSLIVLDEAQHLEDIGLILKIIVDTFPEIQIIATGSSGFELGQKVSEPLTGRARRFTLFPFSFNELQQSSNLINTHAQLENLLRYGSYPEVFAKSEKESVIQLNEIASNYLFKDVLQFERLRRPELLFKLLRALALQIGSEVSYQELSRLLGTNVHTVSRYIELLEQSFVIFGLPSFSKNMRNEISRSRKIYFNDLGIRNAIIQNFNSLDARNDAGALWENFCILERLKHNNDNLRFVNRYFWRTYQGNEIDYIEEDSGKLTAFEFKLNPKKNTKPTKVFQEAYPGSIMKVINRENYITDLFL